jgi:hypothetical protein
MQVTSRATKLLSDHLRQQQEAISRRMFGQSVAQEIIRPHAPWTALPSRRLFVELMDDED